MMKIMLLIFSLCVAAFAEYPFETTTAKVSGDTVTIVKTDLVNGSVEKTIFIGKFKKIVTTGKLKNVPAHDEIVWNK